MTSSYSNSDGPRLGTPLLIFGRVMISDDEFFGA